MQQLRSECHTNNPCLQTPKLAATCYDANYLYVNLTALTCVCPLGYTGDGFPYPGTGCVPIETVSE
jgi:hypothetical protein